MKKNDSNLTEYPRMLLGQYPIRDLQFSPASDQIAAVRRNSVLIYDAETGAEISLITGHIAPITSIFFKLDGKGLMSAREEGAIRISETSTGRCTGTIHDYEGEFVAFSPDGNSFAAKSWGLADWEVDKIHVFDIATSTLVQTIRADNRSGFLGVVFSPDGKTLAISECERHVLDGPCPISLWDISTGSRLKTLTVVGGGAFSIVFSPDGRTLADSGGLWDHRIALWNIQSGKQHRALFTGERVNAWAYSLAFSPDSRVLASGHSDGGVLIWDVATGEQLKTFSGHTAKVSSLCFSPDGFSLATGCEDGTVLLWDIPD